MAHNICRTLGTGKLAVLSLVLPLLTVVATHGQPAPGLDQAPPQATQTGQLGDEQQDSRLQDLSGQQPGPIDAPQQTEQPQPHQQQEPLDQDMARPDRSLMQQGTLQPGQPAIEAGQRGELGVFVLENGGPGVRVARVVAGSAADEAGLEAGDVLMVINGQGVDQPQELIRIIRSIPAGEMANLRVWRDGQEQDLVATLQPMRERYRTNFRGEPSGMNGDLAQRTQRLEQQLNMIMQELQQLRQEVMQLRAGSGTGRGVGTTGVEAQQPPRATQPADEPLDQNSTQPGLDKPPGQPAGTDTNPDLPF